MLNTSGMEANKTKCYTLLKNPEIPSEAHKIIFVIVNSLVSMATVVINTLVIVSFLKLKKLQKPSYLILKVLSYADCAVGVLSNSSLSYMVFYDQFNCVMITVLLSCFFFPLSISAFITFLATIERLLHMRFLDRYLYYITRRRTVIAVITMTICGILAGAFYVICAVNNIFRSAFKVSVVVDLCLFVTVTVLYFRTYRNLQRKINHFKPQNETKADAENRPEANVQFTLTKKVLYILVSLLFGWIPFMIAAIACSIPRYKGWKYWDITFIWTLMAVLFNSALNGTVVIMINKDIRKNIKRSLKRFFGG